MGCQIHEYNVGAQLERIAIDVAGLFPLSDKGNRHIVIAMEYFSKWLEAYAIPNQEASAIAENLVANFFCRFSIPRALHNDQSRNFESRLLQEMLQRLRLSKRRTIPLHPQSGGMVKRYIKEVKE
jgi:hypothetical protein